MRGKIIPTTVILLSLYVLLASAGVSTASAATLKVLSEPNVVQPYSGELGTIEIDDLFLTGPDQIMVILPQGAAFAVRDPDRLIEVPRLLPDTGVVNGVYQDQGPGYYGATMDAAGTMLTFTLAPSDDPAARGNSGTVLVHMPLNLTGVQPGPINVTVRDTAFQLPLSPENEVGNAAVGTQMRNATTPTVTAPLNVAAGGEGACAIQVTTTGRGGAAGAGTNIWFDLPAHFTWKDPALELSGGWSEGDVRADVVSNDRGNSRLLLTVNRAPSGTAVVRLNSSVSADGEAPPGNITVACGGSDPGIGSGGTMVLGSCLPAVPASPAAQPEQPPRHAVRLFIGRNSYTVDGRVYGMDAVPFIQNGRTYVPVRYLARALGAAESGIAWNENTRTMTLTLNGVNLKLTVGAKTGYVNGRASTLDAPPLERNGRVYLPAASVAAAFGLHSHWDAAGGVIEITW